MGGSRNRVRDCALAAALVVCLAAVYADRANPDTRTVGSSLTVTGPTRSRDQVRQQALTMIAHVERSLSRVAIPARVTKITLVQPGDSYSAYGSTFGGDVGYQWAVQVRGTFLGCGSWCDLYTDCVVIISDRTGSEGADGCRPSSHLGHIPLFQVNNSPPKPAPARTAAAATRIALAYLAANDRALGGSTAPTAIRIDSLKRLQARHVYHADPRQGGFKSAQPLWIAKVDGLLANCVQSFHEKKILDYETCTLSSSGYLAIADDKAFPTAVIQIGKITTVSRSAIAAPCALTQDDRIRC